MLGRSDSPINPNQNQDQTTPPLSHQRTSRIYRVPIKVYLPPTKTMSLKEQKLIQGSLTVRRKQASKGESSDSIMPQRSDIRILITSKYCKKWEESSGRLRSPVRLSVSELGDHARCALMPQSHTEAVGDTKNATPEWGGDVTRDSIHEVWRSTSLILIMLDYRDSRRRMIVT